MHKPLSPMLRLAAGSLGVLGALNAHATIIDFQSAPLIVTGPSTYFAAGATRDLTVPGVVTISGGTVLDQETFLPANRTALYGTAFFGTTVAPAHPYLPTVTLAFAAPITNFFLDVYNGQTFDVTYTVSDNAAIPHSASFLLAPNLSSGTTQIGFAAAGDTITITSDAGNLWDFSIDNIGFNESLPTTIPSTVQTPPDPTVIDPPSVTLVAVDTPPPVPTLTPAQREVEGLDRQKRRRGRHGSNGNDLEVRLEAQGLEIEPSPVPLPATLPLLAAALGGLGVMRRRKA